MVGEQQNTKISNLNLYLLNTDIIDYNVGPEVELNHRHTDFQSGLTVLY